MKKFIFFTLVISFAIKPINPIDTPRKIIFSTSIILAIAAGIATVYCHQKEQLAIEQLDTKKAQRARAKKWVCAGVTLASLVAVLVSGIQLYLHNKQHDQKEANQTHQNQITIRNQQLKYEIERNIEALKSVVLSTKIFEIKVQENKTKILDAQINFESQTKDARGKKNKQIIAQCKKRLQLELERIKVGENHANLCREGLRRKLPQIRYTLKIITENITEYQALLADNPNEIIQSYLGGQEQEILEYLGQIGLFQ